jgi:hypothetical protein
VGFQGRPEGQVRAWIREEGAKGSNFHQAKLKNLRSRECAGRHILDFAFRDRSLDTKTSSGEIWLQIQWIIFHAVLVTSVRTNQGTGRRRLALKTSTLQKGKQLIHLSNQLHPAHNNQSTQVVAREAADLAVR